MNPNFHEGSAAPCSSRGPALAVVGVVCLYAPLGGIAITLLQLIHEFDELSRSMPPTDPSSASREIGHVLIPTVVGYGVSAIGLTLVLVAIRRFHFRRHWLRQALLGASLLWLLAFPIGTLLALPALFLLYRQRQALNSPSHDS